MIYMNSIVVARINSYLERVIAWDSDYVCSLNSECFQLILGIWQHIIKHTKDQGYTRRVWRAIILLLRANSFGPMTAYYLKRAFKEVHIFTFLAK